MPDGSSSAAPVTSPGPRSPRKLVMPRVRALFEERLRFFARRSSSSCFAVMNLINARSAPGVAPRCSWRDFPFLVRQEHREQEAHDADDDRAPERGPEIGDVKVDAEFRGEPAGEQQHHRVQDEGEQPERHNQEREGQEGQNRAHEGVQQSEYERDAREADPIPLKGDPRNEARRGPQPDGGHHDSHDEFHRSSTGEVDFGRSSASPRMLRRSGHASAAAITTITVTMPPPTTDTTGPSSAALAPDSNPPSSFEVSMKTLFTADTRPRISSGVRSCTSVCRTTTLIMSSPPARISMTRESGNECESPKTIVARPNPATAMSSDRPALRMGARPRRRMATNTAPIDGAARSQPKPSAPTCRMSFAYTGRSVVAPPKSTANMSSVIAARMILVCHTKRTPPRSDCIVTALGGRATCRFRTWVRQMTNTSISAASMM